MVDSTLMIPVDESRVMPVGGETSERTLAPVPFAVVNAVDCFLTP